MLSVGVGLLIGGGTGAAMAARPSDEAPPPTIYSATSEVHIGDSLGEARLTNGRCEIQEPIHVGVKVAEGGRPATVAWQFDESCRAIVNDIQVLSDDEIEKLRSSGPPTDGDVTRPSDVSPKEGEQR
jgi:hypothetical protein